MKKRIEGMVEGVRQVAALEDPIGQMLKHGQKAQRAAHRAQARAAGLIGIIFEARPNVTVDALAVLCLKAGTPCCCAAERGLHRIKNSALGKYHARRTSRRRDCRRTPYAGGGYLPGKRGGDDDAVRNISTFLSPRGGAGMIRSVVEHARVPVIETGVGNCQHLRGRRRGTLKWDAEIIFNAKKLRARRCATPPRRCSSRGRGGALSAHGQGKDRPEKTSSCAAAKERAPFWERALQ